MSLYIASLDLPEQRDRFAQVAWSGPPPPAGSDVVTTSDGRTNYYLSRGPVVYLIETEGERVQRAWVWRLEDAESLRVRWPPAVSDKWIEVRDLHGDRVIFDRTSGRVLAVEHKL